MANLEGETIYSQGRYLDVMPRGMSKGSATLYLASHFGLGLEAVMTAGDSGNDVSRSHDQLLPEEEVLRNELLP